MLPGFCTVGQVSVGPYRVTEHQPVTLKSGNYYIAEAKMLSDSIRARRQATALMLSDSIWAR